MNNINDKTKENTFISGVCRFTDPDSEFIWELHEKGLDYIYILGQLLYNRVGGAAYYTLNKINLFDKLNREFKNTLTAIYENNIKKAEEMKVSLDIIGGVLSVADFHYALLKGSYLINLYPLGLRTSNDIDILINFKSLSALSKLLSGAGFIQGYVRNGVFTPATRAQILTSQMNRGETVPFVLQTGFDRMKYLEIDVNFSLDFKNDSERTVVNKFLDNVCGDIETKNGNLYTLAKDDFIMHLCAHLYKEASVYNWIKFGRDQGLYKYLDIYLMEEMFPDIINYDKINGFGLQKECYYALNGVNRIFGCEIDLSKIQIENTDFLKRITDFGDRKAYTYEMDISDWVYCGKREDNLIETQF